MRGLWDFVFRIINLTWVMPGRVGDVLVCWSRKFADPLAQVIWKMILFCIWWCLWREHNQRCFDDSTMSSNQLQDTFLLSIYLWANVMMGGPFLDFPDFVSFFACMI